MAFLLLSIPLILFSSRPRGPRRNIDDRQAAQNLDPTLGVSFLHALFLLRFAGGGGLLVPLDFRDVLGVVDVP